VRVVVCAKEVLDPDAVASYALAGRLVIGDDGKTLAQTTIPRLLNAYDEQAIEAALRLRDAGVELALHVVSVGLDSTDILKHAAALGADEITAIPADPSKTDHHVVARLLGAYIRSSGGADLVLCGRQASDDDLGVVPALLGELLGMPVITLARAVELLGSASAATVRVTRVTPEGEEVVECACPAVVTVSSEIGTPRYPTTARKLAARRMKPAVVALDDLLRPEETRALATLVRQLVPAIEGRCEIILGATPDEAAERLLERLHRDRVLTAAAEE
jgi:electron transfer flavoprotein beta subunit